MLDSEGAGPRSTTVEMVDDVRRWRWSVGTVPGTVIENRKFDSASCPNNPARQRSVYLLPPATVRHWFHLSSLAFPVPPSYPTYSYSITHLAPISESDKIKHNWPDLCFACFFSHQSL